MAGDRSDNASPGSSTSDAYVALLQLARSAEALGAERIANKLSGFAFVVRHAEPKGTRESLAVARVALQALVVEYEAAAPTSPVTALLHRALDALDIVRGLEAADPRQSRS